MAALWIGQAFSTPHRVACRAGLPPFADVVDGECVGIMADLFVMSAHTAGFNYTITPFNYASTTAVAVNSKLISHLLISASHSILSRQIGF